MQCWCRSISVGVVLFLASCTQTFSPTPIKSGTETWFTDRDLDNAVLDVAAPNPIVSTEGLETGEITNHAPLTTSPKVKSDVEAQAVLNGTNGFVYFIQKLVVSSTRTDYQIIRQDQATGTNLTFAQFQNREVISVAGTADGNTVLASIKETTSSSSDFEVFKLVRNGTVLAATQLTNNTNINERAVAISANGLRLVWQGVNPDNNRGAIFIRSLNPTGTLQSEGFLSSTNQQFEPTVSANGKFVVFREDEPPVSTLSRIRRHNIETNTTTTIVSSSTVDFKDPSITDDGTKVAYLELPSTIRLKTVGGANQVILSVSGLSHPHITRNGQFLTYTKDFTGIQNVITRHLATGLLAQTSNVVGSNDAFGSYWQLPLAFTTETKLTAFDGQENDFLGRAIDLDGDTLVVGAVEGVYIFERNLGGPNNWGFRKELNVTTAIGFGISVAISGDFVVVGASGDNDDRGAIYIFRRNQGGANNWGLFRRRVASDRAIDDRFGTSLDIDGDTIVVGAPRNKDNGSSSGSAYIFKKDQGGTNNWGEVTKLLASDAAELDIFGQEVAISGDTVVIGAEQDENAKGFFAGAIYVFQRNPGTPETWTQVRKRTASDGVGSDFLGRSVAIEGDVIMAGSGANGSGGAVYVFNRGNNNAWNEVKKIVPSDLSISDGFANSGNIDIDGDTVIVGANFKNSQTGAAYIFKKNQGGTNNWGEVKKLTASDSTTFVNFGTSVAISGETVVVGKSGDNEVANDAGAAYIYE